MKDEFEDIDVLKQMRDVLTRALNKAKEQYPDLKPYELRHHLPDSEDVIKLLKQFFPDIEHVIMDETNNDVMLEHLEGTHELGCHDEDVREDYYRNEVHELVRTLYEAKVDLSSKIRDGYPDDLWTLFCDAFGITYYDKTAFLQHWDEFQKKLMNCTYSQLCDRKVKK
jgi:cation transport regulator ChaB